MEHDHAPAAEPDRRHPRPVWAELALRAPAGPDPAPVLLCDLATVVDRHRRLVTALPGLACYYAVKANPSPTILEVLHHEGCGFEIASLDELHLLLPIGVRAGDVLYSNPVKPAAHVAAAAELGVWRFAFDGEAELHKLARTAPGAAVYLRVRVQDGWSRFPLSAKFGADPRAALELLVLARSLGLRPYGVTFHVGSQCTQPAAWTQALQMVGTVMAQARTAGIDLDMVDVGGGFPAVYDEPVPAITEIADAIRVGLDHLPYGPAHLAAEPGRYLVAESGVMVATVIGREERADGHWLYLDVGAYNGLMETQQSGAQWQFPVWVERSTPVETMEFVVTGPSCDSSDTMFRRARLPVDVAEGDRIAIGSAGAYTLSYVSRFNGFPGPAAAFVSAPRPRSTPTGARRLPTPG